MNFETGSFHENHFRVFKTNYYLICSEDRVIDYYRKLGGQTRGAAIVK